MEEKKINLLEHKSSDDVIMPVEVVEEEQPLTLVSPTGDILNAIQKAETKEEFDALEEMFKLSLAKKELTRVATQDELLDALLEQAKKRIAKSGELSNKDLLDYYNAFDSMVSRSSKKKSNEDADTGVLINQTKNEVTINMTGDGLNRDSQNKVMDVVNSIIQQAKNTGPVESVEISEEEGVDTND